MSKLVFLIAARIVVVIVVKNMVGVVCTCQNVQSLIGCQDRNTYPDLFFSYSLCEAVDSPVQQVMPQTVLQKTFWTESESVFFNKQINILVDWVIRSYREKYKKNDVRYWPIIKHNEELLGIFLLSLRRTRLKFQN